MIKSNSFRSYHIKADNFRSCVKIRTSVVNWNQIPSEAMGATKKAKVTFTCTDEIKGNLEVWAELENRTVSNLVEKLVMDAIAAKQPLPRKQDRKIA